jgi:hypothetical protein
VVLVEVSDLLARDSGAVLTELMARARRLTRRTDVVAPLDGECFELRCSGLAGPDVAPVLVGRLMAAFSDPVLLAEGVVRPTVFVRTRVSGSSR